MLSKGLRIMLDMAGVICVFCSIYILVFYPATFHAGTLLMLLSGLLFLFFGIAFPLLQKSHPDNIFIKICFWITIVYFAFCAFFFTLLYLYGRPTLPANPNDSTVIVLGSKVANGRPSLTLQYRLDQAVNYLEKYPEANCIVSGGQGESETETEASVMAEYLVEQGISPSRIFEEDESLDTIQNISYSKTIIEGNGLSESVVIATNSFHEMRSQMLAYTVGFENVYSLPAKTPPALLLSYYFREILSMGKIVVLGEFSFLPSPFR